MNGTSAPHTPTPPPGSAPGSFFESVRRIGIWRTADRWGGGVAAGIGHRFGIDPIVVRGLFVVVTMFGGLGLVLYGLAWALLPEASDGRIHLEQAVKGDFDIALAGATAVVIVGISRPVFWWSASWWAVPWLVVLGALIAVVLLGRDRTPNRADHQPTGEPPPPGQPGPGAGSAADAAEGPPAAAGTAPPPRPAYDIPEDTMSQPPTPEESGGPGTEVITRPTAVGPALSTTIDDGAGHDTTGRPTGHPADEPHGADQRAWDTGSDRYGSGWDGGGSTPPQPPQPPPPGPPPTPPVPGPGSRTTSLVLAICLLGAAGIALAHQQGVLDANPWLIGGGAVLTVLGAGVLVSGMRGRTQGGLGVLALLLAVVMVPTAAAAAALPGFSRIGTTATTWAGDPSWTPRTASEAEEGYTLVAGDLTVDLTRLDADDDVTIPVAVTFGTLNLTVPDDASVTVNAGVGAGEIVGSLDDDWTGPGVQWWASTGTDDSLTNGVGVDTTLRQEGTGPEIIIDAEVSLGQITIKEMP